MELRHVRYFLSAAELGSFSRAAERLGVSQPTLSHQIKQLESIVGAVLFDRGARKVELTAAGKAFRPYCERLLKELDAGVLAVSELEGLMRGTLRMAVFHSFSKSLLGPVLAEFAMRYPGVHVVARLVPRMEMERGLLSGELDLAVAYVSEDSEHIAADILFEEELVLVVGSKHPLARRRSTPMRSLANINLVLLTQEFAARRREVRALFRARAQVDPRPRADGPDGARRGSGGRGGLPRFAGGLVRPRRARRRQRRPLHAMSAAAEAGIVAVNPC